VPQGGPPSKATVPAVKCQIWRNLPGAQITDTLATNDLQRQPDETRTIDKLEFAPGLKDGWACSISGLNYASGKRGLLVPHRLARQRAAFSQQR